MQSRLMEIKTKIEALTTDEDVRQDLWVAILESPSQDPADTFQRTIDNAHFENQLSIRVSLILQRPPSRSTIDLIAAFTPVEQSIMVLLMLGFDVVDISRYKSLRPMWLNQMIRNIALHPIWESYLSEEET
jgi:hypothetical protein